MAGEPEGKADLGRQDQWLRPKPTFAPPTVRRSSRAVSEKIAAVKKADA